MENHQIDIMLMAADYVGNKIAHFLCERNERITVLVYDTQDRGGFNNDIIQTVKSHNPNVIILTENDMNDNSTLSDIKTQGIRLGVLAWWPYIINDEIIGLTDKGFVNTHPGYLPYNRGKHPYFWSIVEGTPYGVTLHKVDKDIDSGDIIEQLEIPVGWLDTGESLYLKSREEILNLFYKHFDSIMNGLISVKPQKLESGTFHYGKEIEPISNIELDKLYTARDLFNIIRGRMFNGTGYTTFVDKLDGGKEYSVSIIIREKGSH